MPISSNNSSRPSLWEFLLRLFHLLPAEQSPIPTPEPVHPIEPVKILTRKVLLVVYDPLMDASLGLNLISSMKWNRAEDLVAGFIQDILQASSGLARFQVVERHELNEFPPLLDGFRYDAHSYSDVIRKLRSPHTPPMADYPLILKQLNILPRITRGDFDELWLFGFPHAGFYESSMGGTGAFWCNSPPIAGTGSCPRRFVVMGFSYERGIGEMLESFGHRAESILEKTFARYSGTPNLYEKYTRYDKKYPGFAEVGSIHFAPNSNSDYDWNNPRLVKSGCDDWDNFPAFQGLQRKVNADEWGNGDIRKHHLWWLKHLPHAPGLTGGIQNNWWQYILDPSLVSS